MTVTLTTASLLGLIFIWLSVRVIGLRVKNDALIGDVGNSELQFAIRTHGNFTEFAPLFLIILGGLELSGGSQTALVAIAVLFVIARLLHIPGMGPGANLKLRQAGIAGSFLSIGAASLYGLFLAVI